MAGYIGIQPTPQATQTRDTFTATSNQTSFPTSGYTPEFLDVFMNGVHLLNGTDYTASNGSDVVLAVGATTGDIIEVVAYSTFTVADPTFTGTTTLGATLLAPSTFTIDPAVHGANSGTVVIAGDLTVNGTTTTINSTTLTVDDLNLTLASGAADSSAANGAGITIDGASASLTYAHSGTKFVFNKPLDVTGKVTSSLGLVAGSLLNSADNSLTILGGGSATNNGANLTLYGGSAAASAGDFRFRVGTAEKFRVLSTGATVTGEIDVSTLIKVGVNDTEYANNYIRFKPAGAAYIDHNTVGQDINIRTSVSSSLDTTPVIIKAGGSVGLGVTPGVWSANYPALQIGQGATFTGHKSNTQTQLGQNWWVGTGNQYVVNGTASRIVMNPDSSITFSQAPSGTAGATMSSITNPLVISAAGNATFTGTANSAGLTVTGNSFIGNSSSHDADARLHVAASDTSPDLSATTPASYTALLSNSDGSYGTMFATYGSGLGEIQQRRTNDATTYPLALNPHGGSVGIGTTTPSQNQTGSVVPKLHVKAPGTNGAYDLVARFQAGNDISTTGASILINHENDRGLLIEAGRANGGDIGVAHFGVTNSGGVNTRALTILATGSTSNNVGIGTASPGSKLEVYNSAISGNTQLHIHNDKTSDAAVLRLEGKRTSLNDTGQVLFVNSGNVVAKIDARSAADDGALRFFTSATGTGDTIAEAMSIATNKAVAIGGPVTITSDTEYQFKINASSGAGASMAAITAGSYAYTVHQNSSKQWRNGAYGGSSYSIVNATDGVYPLILSSSGAATFVSTVQATELICTSNGITFSGAHGKTIIKTGRRQGTGTYTLFTNGSGSTQSAGTVEIWGIYGTPSGGSYANYLISGNRSIQTVIAHTQTNSVPVVSLAWNGAALQVSNSNGSLYYNVRVTLGEIGNSWAPTWGNFPGMS